MGSSECYYVMRKSVLTGLSTRHGSIHCRVCGEPIEEGEEVVSKSTSRNNVKLSHRDCWEKLFLDV